MIQPSMPADFLPFAHRLAECSGVILKRFGHGVRGFESKSDSSPVTAIDREVEAALRAAIAAEYPDHGILGEEFEPSNLDNEWVWVLDPIDGTKQFIAGIPLYGTLIALARNGFPVLGIIDHPATGERWSAAEGTPALCNGRAVTTRARRSLPGSLMFTTSPEPFDDDERRAVSALRSEAAWCVYGAGCYGYARLASGQLDIGVEAGHDPFDYCALAPIIRAAGGVISDWEGRPLGLTSGQRFVASATPELHEEVLATLARELVSRPESVLR
ncbi:inositol monophosphatase family protein [Bosea sp. 117]|uniref:inositol monophosphatase family protein n=1 Tax=Bosea sp. 117 TaxID=1125973 RepID=UPI000A7F9733|nr:inositol monophosphatase family protein [Bosea sp. 117]